MLSTFELGIKKACGLALGIVPFVSRALPFALACARVYRRAGTGHAFSLA